MAAPEAFISFFYQSCCSHDGADSELSVKQKAAHLVNAHTPEILDKNVKPYFAHKHPALDRRKRRNPDKQPDVEFYENQLWKENSNDGWNAVEVLRWIVVATRDPNLEPVLPVIVPPVLTLIDDYEVEYKATGVVLLRHIMDNVEPTVIKKTGLIQVFFDAVSKCLSYTTDPERDIPLMTSSYPCILNLVRISRVAGTEEWFSEFDTVMSTILNGLKYGGNKLAIRKVLIEQISDVYDGLEPLGVKHLKYVIPILCETIELPFPVSAVTKRAGIFGLHLSSLASLICVTKHCWPRIPHYQGVILKSIAVAWRRSIERIRQSGDLDQPTSELQSQLIEMARLLKAVCGVRIQEDIDALLRLDVDVFRQLLVS